ncbi:hypothetical protein [Fusobacterium ulcerans]|uniref:hypothetical protein n=1 Tax=Fusobacterium ulcerans TaxID=861 RepID=UPI0026DABD5A|nr:hypothetical protein [Fusobacterium ulcerans]
MKLFLVALIVIVSLYVGLIARFKIEEISIRKFKMVFLSIPFFILLLPLILFILSFKTAHSDKGYNFYQSIKISLLLTLKLSFEIEFWLKVLFLAIRKEEMKLKKYQVKKNIFKEVIPKYLAVALIG